MILNNAIVQEKNTEKRNSIITKIIKQAFYESKGCQYHSNIRQYHKYYLKATSKNLCREDAVQILSADCPKNTPLYCRTARIFWAI